MSAKSNKGASFLCLILFLLRQMRAPSLQHPLETLGLHLVPGNYNHITTLLEVGDDESKCVCFLCGPEVVGLHL